MKHVMACILLAAASASAQTGTVDQVSPATNANFNLSASSLIWQAQIKSGVAGQLEGIQVTLTGVQGAQGDVRIRKGAAPSGNAPVFTTTLTKATAGTEVVFVDMTAANIMLAAGETFVMETQGNDTGMGINGSYVAPPGTPLYAEPLFLNGSNFADGGWRHGFTTYMLSGSPCYPDCDGDGVLTLADFGCFQTKFALGDLYADCNNDLVLNLADFGCFQTEFALGCP